MLTLDTHSAVINSAREPFPGWIDNLYGPGGVVLAAGSGLMHTLHAGKDKTADLVPVDLACNALLAAAWETASLTWVSSTPTACRAPWASRHTASKP